MGKDREGKFHPKKGKPTGPGRVEGTAGTKSIDTSGIDNYMEIADKYTVGEEEPAANVHVRHPNRNTDKNENRTNDKKDNNDNTTPSYKSKAETFAQDATSSATAQELPVSIARDQLARLSGQKDGSCISIFFPTHQSGVEKNEQQDAIVFKNYLQQATAELKKKGTAQTEIEKLLKPGYDLLRENKFWLSLSKGLAVFISDGEFKYVRLPIAPKEEMLINNSYYLAPLIPLITVRDYFYVLMISKKQARLYRADQYGIDYIPIPEMPNGIDDVVHFENKDDQKLFKTESAGAGQGANYHGIGAGKPDDKENIAMYFDEVDETLWKAVLNQEHAPLLLAGVEYLIPIYKSVAKYKYISDELLTGNQEYEDIHTIHQLALKKMAPYFRERHDKALEMYGNNSATALTSNIPAEVIPAAHYSRVWHLFVQKDVHIWGKFDEMKNELTMHDEKEEGDECLVDKAVIRTVLTAGEVHFLPADQMPGGSKIAALMRY